MEYVKRVKGEYSNDFLNWVGWENTKDKLTPYSLDIKKSLIRTDSLRIKLESAHSQFYGESLRAQIYSFFSIYSEKYASLFDGLYQTRIRVEFDDNYQSFLQEAFKHEKLSQKYKNLWSHTLEIPPDDEMQKLLLKFGLKTIDSSYDFNELTDEERGQGKKYLDLKDCHIPKAHIDILNKMTLGEFYYPRMKEVWLSTLPPVMKFFLQNIMDSDLNRAQEFKKILERGKYSCILFAHHLYFLIDQHHTKIPLKDFQKFYDDVAAQ